jgi:hypothetical protein
MSAYYLCEGGVPRNGFKSVKANSLYTFKRMSSITHIALSNARILNIYSIVFY